MNEVGWHKEIRRHILPLVSLLLLVGCLAAIVLHVAQSRGLYPGVIGFFQDADRLLATHAIGSAFYPPFVIWLVAFLKAAHVPLRSSVFNGVWLLLGASMVYLWIYLLTKHRGWAWLGTVFVLANPYFIWTVMLSNDTGPEWVWLLCVLLSLSISTKTASTRLAQGLMIVGATASVLTRITGIYIIGAILLGAWVFDRARLRVRVYTGLISLGLACLVLFSWNYLQVGVFTLSTNGGINLYFGNHPDYLQGHPHYDIDGFLGQYAAKDVDGSLTETQKDAAYKTLGIMFIRRDPAAFLYRGIVKSEWYWVGIEKIPNYSGNVSVAMDTHTIQLPSLDVRQGLAYLFYRLLCLGVVGAWFVGKRWKALLPAWLVWSGWIGLWPIIVLTFPDTRFRLPLETILSVWVVCLVYGFWTQRHNLLQSSL